MSELLHLDRRSLLSQALLLVGATATAGLSGSALAKVAAGPKRFLDAPNFTVLSAVADTIVPRTKTAGAVDAGVPATFDALLLNWASPATRTLLKGALLDIDQQARTQQGKGFAALSPEARLAFLTPYDAAASKVVPVTGATKNALSALMSGPPTANPSYSKLKQLLVTLYYLSEPALTQELSYEHAPGEWKPSIPVTPDTRPAAGGAF
ncbi:gluconate 2-dehydrogenase subunit 3 family protein [Sphingobium sufflavum]|uniref:gluconate 2-dehydrogenase subunit 3 family protein n=1 Tax=Sphingobium sufflavum TaxID=1129547 RepID=UPI001F3CB558|nr:gluconate 2-dehydrogenase subunit 3 family protein [Sphingobium sufflavum]MCE7795996.1 gluconate 2-dehydrogenase subunit 3 family protein [Sphingobium sufflavum]